MRLGVVVAALAAACVVWVAPSAGTPAACDPGTRVVKGTTIHVYCGPAKATVKVGGKTYRIFGGKCKRTPGTKLYEVDVGIITVAGSKPTARYLGIRSKRLTPGTTTTAGVAVQVAKSAYNVAPNVVKIGKGMRSGTFSGDALGRAGRVSGSWTC
jgi:hypothetical protein